MGSKKIIVTGASSGFGLLAIAALARRGHQVLAALRGGPDRLTKVVSELPAEISGPLMHAIREGQVKGVQIEMTQRESFEAIKGEIESHWEGECNVLVNNAGLGVLGPFELNQEKDLRYQMEVNFFGLYFLTQTLLPYLRKSQGTVINLSSIAGLCGIPMYSAYNASKFAVEGMSEALFYEMKDFGVKVALIEPGGFKTSFVKNASYGDQSFQSHPIYGDKVKAIETMMKERGQRAAPGPEPVVQRIVSLCESNNPRYRNVIGKDAKAAWWSNRLLPHQLFLTITHRIFKKLVKF